MSLARALTTVRRVRGITSEEPAQTIPQRSGTLRKTDFRVVDRAKISLPVTLLSTTNALAYDAPDIPRVTAMVSPSTSLSSSRRSYECSESGASSATSISTPALSREGSPVLEAKNSSSYFSTSPKKLLIDLPEITPLSPVFKEIEIPPTTPAVPSRALSHTKRTHQALARKRSLSRLSGEAQSNTGSRVVSSESIASPIEEHPFGAELTKVMEVAEEFGVKDVYIWNEEEQFLMDQGLLRFSAEDYITEIQPLFGMAFYNSPVPNIPTWL